VLVVDASVLAPALADAGSDGERSRDRLRGEVIFGPDLLRIEVTSVLRRRAGTGLLTSEQADVGHH
jgi:predicted nucleic acid-binding protein